MLYFLNRDQLAAVVERQSPAAPAGEQSTQPSAAVPGDAAPSGAAATAAGVNGTSAAETPASQDTQVAALPPATPNAPPTVTKDTNPAEPSFRIQVASVGNADQAQAEWARISNRHPDLLGRLQGFYPEFTSSNGNTYTRVQGGPLVDKALAELLCSQLKARKVDCFVIEP